MAMLNNQRVPPNIIKIVKMTEKTKKPQSSNKAQVESNHRPEAKRWD